MTLSHHGDTESTEKTEFRRPELVIRDPIKPLLRYRFLLGTVFIAALAGLCWLDGMQVFAAPPGTWLFPLALVLSVPGSNEILSLVGSQNRPRSEVVYLGNLAIVAANGIPVVSRFFSLKSTEPLLNGLLWPLGAFILAVLI